MRYGSMTILKGIQELVDQGVEKILLFPLYPQFAMATTETISVLVKEICIEHFPDLIIEEIKPFYNNQDYINVLSKSIKSSIDLDKIEPVSYTHLTLPTILLV